MQLFSKSTLAAAGLYLLCLQPASALTVTLGTQFFQPGDVLANGTQLNNSFIGEPAPFNSFIGIDAGGPNFSANWTFNYGAIAGITSASLSIGILDADTAAPGNQVGAFSVNGIDLTSLLNTTFEANPVSTNVYAIYSIVLPSTTFSSLSNGSANVSLSLLGPGLAVLGQTDFNGAALDFSSLTLSNQVTPPPQNVPAPAAGVLLLTALPWLTKRRKKA